MGHGMNLALAMQHEWEPPVQEGILQKSLLFLPVVRRYNVGKAQRTRRLSRKEGRMNLVRLYFTINCAVRDHYFPSK